MRVSHATPRFPLLRAAVLLVMVRASLRIRGFARTLSFVRDSVADEPVNEELSADVVESIAHSVATAAAFFPGRARCLEQSLVLYYVLRRSHAAARFRMGVQPYGFQSHAWVEYQGRPINERGEALLRLARLPDVLP
jgi:hypothetical protein